MDHHSGNRDRPQRRGFRGTAENAKTKICMRYVDHVYTEWGGCVEEDRVLVFVGSIGRASHGWARGFLGGMGS